MRWYEYKMEVDDVHAPDDLKAKLLAMQNSAKAASDTTPKPQLTPAPPERPAAAKKKPIRFPVKRVLEVAACVGLCGVCLYGAGLSQNGWTGISLLSGGSAASSAAVANYDIPETANYSLADTGGVSTYSMQKSVAVDNSDTALLTSGDTGTARTADSAKIIYTAYLSLETKDFDTARQALDDALNRVGGYLESSNESTDTDNTRSLSLTLRVPEEAYQDFLATAAQAGNLTGKSETADDVTTQTLDLQARLDNLTAQRTRLQELQASADNLSDLLQIESSLSDVQYQIESYQSQLSWYTDQVECCTVNITLDEVETLTPADNRFSTRLGEAFRNGWANFLSGAQAVAVFLTGAWPAIVIGAVCGVVFYRVRHPRKKS